VDVVFAIFKLGDDFTDQNDNQLGHSVQISLTQVLVQLDLAVEGVETDINQSLYLELSKEVT